MYVTAPWLREAFSDLTWEVHDSVQEDDLVTVHATMTGRQTGTFVTTRRPPSRWPSRPEVGCSSSPRATGSG